MAHRRPVVIMYDISSIMVLMYDTSSTSGTMAYHRPVVLMYGTSSTSGTNVWHIVTSGNNV